RHHRSRSPRAWVFGSAGLAGGIAVAAVAVILLANGGSPEAAPTPLATHVTGTQAVGLANPGLVQADGTVAGIGNLLAESPAGPAFTSSTKGQTVLPSQQWQADQMVLRLCCGLLRSCRGLLRFCREVLRFCRGVLRSCCGLLR